VPFAIACVVVVWLTGCLFFFGRRTPSFEHRRALIRELGQSGAPYEQPVSYGVFLPTGIGALLISGLLFRHGPGPIAVRAALFCICIGIGYLSAAFWHIVPPSLGHEDKHFWFHYMGGAVQYFGGGAALWWVASALDGPFAFLAACGGVLLWLLCIGIECPSLSAWQGVIQRSAEVILFGTLLVFGYWLQ
jgi:hypothetical protein